jgi:predicted ATPase
VRQRTGIRTPDQRLRVFVSSTLQELAPERATARAAISALRMIPVLFELGARPHPPRDLYQAYLEQSDIFIGIYWERYGWIAPDMTISGLEDEYHLSRGLPRLIYVKEPSPRRDSRMRDLLDFIEADGAVSYQPFSTPEDLHELIQNDLAILFSERFIDCSSQTSNLVEKPGEERSAPRLMNLPRLRTSLIGREQEIASIKDLLLKEETGLLTLTGPGGVGKTRLGLQVAHELRDHFVDGVCYVALDSIGDPTLLVSAIAQALGVHDAGGQPLIDSVKSALTERHLLLGLDNFEQVIDAAPIIADVLIASPKLKILVTSRMPLRLRGEREFSVAPLSLPGSSEQGDRNGLSQYAAVQLFVHRALEVNPKFEVTDESAPVVAEICSRLDGLPLAIELAAARIRVLPPHALLARLKRCLPILCGGARDLPERQQTMRDAIAWSYGLLAEDEKRLFRRLSIFSGGFSLDTAERVCDADGQLDLFDGLSSLVTKNLVRPEETAQGEPRFRMLQVIREYGLECMAAAGEYDEIARHQAMYFLGFVEAIEPKLRSGERPRWSAQLNVEKDNLRASLEWFLDQSDRDQEAMRLAGAQFWHWYFQGQFTEGRNWLERSLEKSNPSERSEARAKALFGAGVLAWGMSDFPGHLAYATESAGIWREIDRPDALGYTLTILGMHLLWTEGYASKCAVHEEAAACFERVGDSWGLAFLFALSSWADLFAGKEIERAKLEMSECLFRELGDEWGRALALHGLAIHSSWGGDLVTAVEMMEQSLGLFTASGDTWHSSVVLNDLGLLAMTSGDLERAETLLDQGLRLRQELGNGPRDRMVLAGNGLARYSPW